MLHIGLVLSSLPGYSETFIHSRINGLLNQGFKVSLFASVIGNADSLDISVPVYFQVNIKNKSSLFIALISSIIFHPLISIRFIKLEISSHRNWIRAIKNLITNSHIIGKSLNWVHFEYATIAINRENVADAMKIDSAVSFRGFDISLYPHQHPGCYNLLWQKINKVHTISDDLYNRAIHLGLNPSTPYKKITPAINIDYFTSNANQDLHKPVRILTVGRLTWVKGYIYALKALGLLKNKKFNFEYHIVGDGNYRESICYAVNQLMLTNNVMIKGQLSHKEVKDEMEWADIYLQPSIQEGFCNSVLEAQAMGLLCIVTNAGGLSENVIHKQTGWVVSKRSSESISEQIIEIINLGTAQHDKIKKNAINRVNNQFQITEQIKNWAEFY